MKRLLISVCALALSTGCSTTTGRYDLSVPQDQLPKELVGTWKLVSATYGGRESSLPTQMLVLKHMTPTHETWMRIDPKSREVVAMAGSRWRLEGAQLIVGESGYGLSPTLSSTQGTTDPFSCRIVGNRWYHNGALGNGLTIDEIWERVNSTGDGDHSVVRRRAGKSRRSRVTRPSPRVY